MSFEIAKAGWLYRQSTVLKRWKKNWFVLYTDGHLKYFVSQDSHYAEEAALVPTQLLFLKTAMEVTDVVPPEGLYRNCLFSLGFHGKTWHLCATSPDDMKAWQYSIEEARLVRPVRHDAMAQVHHDAPVPAHYDAPVPVHHDAPPPYSAAQQPCPPCTQYCAPHPPPYVVQTVPVQTVYQVPAGQTTVIYTNQPGPAPYYYRRGCDGTDVALGMVAGAAIGSMMWGPLLWW